MDFDAIAALSRVTGLIYFVGLFAGVLIYALWPRNQETFDRAAHAPLSEEDDE